jgi:hypothetical protein
MASKKSDYPFSIYVTTGIKFDAEDKVSVVLKYRDTDGREISAKSDGDNADEALNEAMNAILKALEDAILPNDRDKDGDKDGCPDCECNDVSAHVKALEAKVKELETKSNSLAAENAVLQRRYSDIAYARMKDCGPKKCSSNGNAGHKQDVCKKEHPEHNYRCGYYSPDRIRDVYDILRRII